MSAILYDARGNELRSGFPDLVTNETVTDARPSTAVLSALNAEVLIDLNGAATCNFDVRTGAASLTLAFEGTVDGTNYIALPALIVGGTIFASGASPEEFVSTVVITTTHAATYAMVVSAFRRVRIRVSAYTSGNVTIAARASGAAFMLYAKPTPAVEAVTVTAAANAGATLTLPAAGAGLFHYITGLYIARTATAALTGTATLVITTTNLPGSMAFSVGNAMVAGGTQRDVELTPAFPIKSSVANTATTVVMPVPGAAVLWRAYAFYYIGA